MLDNESGPIVAERNAKTVHATIFMAIVMVLSLQCDMLTQAARACSATAVDGIMVYENDEWVDRTDQTIYVALHSMVHFWAVPFPEGSQWAQGHPIWSDDATGYTGEFIAITFDTAGTYEITTGPDTQTVTVVVVELSKLQWRLSGGTWADVTGTLYVAKGTQVEFKAIKNPSGSNWPSGKPVWTGATPDTPPDTAAATFNSVSSSSTDYKTVTCACGNTKTANVVVVEIDKIQWRLSGGTYADVPDPATIYVAKDAQVDFKAIIKPSGSSWPSGKPVWTGATPNTPPDTASVTFSSVGSQTVTCECGNSKSVNVVVCDKIKISLGNSANLSSCIVGKVYVPTYWGGTLKFTGSSVELFYTNGSDLDINTATSVIKGDMNDYRVAQGSSYTVPIEKYKWYYVKITEPTMTAVTATFEQSIAAKRTPWTCEWYPVSEEGGPNLYDVGGCLDKYDAAYGRTSKDREKRNCYNENVQDRGHYIRKNTIIETDAEMTLGYDLNNADADNNPWTGWADDVPWNCINSTVNPFDWTFDSNNNGDSLDEGDGDTNDTENVSWWGHCHDAAAVVVSENEPQNDVTINSITFTAEDQKGLLVALYHDHEPYSYRGPDLKPHAWHAMLEERLLNVSPEDGSPIPKMFVCDNYNSGLGVDIIWNHPIYKIEKAEYKEKPGQTDEKLIEVKCEVKYWDKGANSLYYWYNITYGTDGLAASSEDSDWKEHPSAPANYKKPDSVYAPILQTTIGGFWGGQMNYNEIRAIVPAPTPTPTP